MKFYEKFPLFLLGIGIFTLIFGEEPINNSENDSTIPKTASVQTIERNETNFYEAALMKLAETFNISNNSIESQDSQEVYVSNNYNSCYSTKLGREVTEYEMYLLKMICASESGLEIFDGKVAVVANVLNRIVDKSSLFPDSVYDVIFQSGQYSSAKNGKFYNDYGEILWEDLPENMRTEIELAVLAALDGADPTEEVLNGGSLFFYNPDYCSPEELAMRTNIKITCRIGNHVFYREWNPQL